MINYLRDIEVVAETGLFIKTFWKKLFGKTWIKDILFAKLIIWNYQKAIIVITIGYIDTGDPLFVAWDSNQQRSTTLFDVFSMCNYEYRLKCIWDQFEPLSFPITVS